MIAQGSAMIMYRHDPTPGIDGGVFFPHPPLPVIPEHGDGARDYGSSFSFPRNPFCHGYDEDLPNTIHHPCATPNIHGD
ncbi:MAG: hypothetical protein MK110_14605 [Fuerstiella sp.]|nr:hypothetical protein [Fuerstiella sp.]